MILLLDNYDSFTYNLYQAFTKLNYSVKVVRSDKISLDEIKAMDPSHIVLSPGPGGPDDAGVCKEVALKLRGQYPILGVCLGHQALLNAYGVPIVNAERTVHGKVEPLIHDGRGLFRNIPQNTMMTRYHSLCAREEDIPNTFEVSARAEDGTVMAVRHKHSPLFGVQFHPESIGTPEGQRMLQNFLYYRRENVPVKAIIGKAVSQEHLTFEEARDVMDELTQGNMHDAQIGSLLASLKIKGVTAEELAGFATTLRSKAVDFPKPEKGEIRVDTCGTGGAHTAKTFNVSTVSAILLSSAGVHVVKHGNRAVTSKSGSADVLEKLGVNAEMSIARSIECYENLGLTFLYARKYHGAMKYAGPSRAALGYRTAFNLIGPLSNPAQATHQIIGVFAPEYTEKVALALGILGVQRALVVHGHDGLDEISLSAPTRITELKPNGISTYDFSPESVGLDFVLHENLVGGSAEDNAEIARSILSGEPSPKADLVCLNAGAALYIAEEAATIRDGFELAREIQRSGKGLEKLQAFAKLSSGEA